MRTRLEDVDDFNKYQQTLIACCNTNISYILQFNFISIYCWIKVVIIFATINVITTITVCFYQVKKLLEYCYLRPSLLLVDHDLW